MPEDPRAPYGLGVEALEKGDHAEALDPLARSLASDPHPETHQQTSPNVTKTNPTFIPGSTLQAVVRGLGHLDAASAWLVFAACAVPVALIHWILARGQSDATFTNTLVIAADGPTWPQHLVMAFATARITRNAMRAEGIAVAGGFRFGAIWTSWLVLWLVTEGLAWGVLPGVALLCMAVPAQVDRQAGTVAAVLTSIRLSRGQRCYGSRRW